MALKTETLKKYKVLNFLLAALHYTVSGLVIGSRSDEQFKARPPGSQVPIHPPRADPPSRPGAAGLWLQQLVPRRGRIGQLRGGVHHHGGTHHDHA